MPDATRWRELSDALDALLDLDPADCERELTAIAQRDPAMAEELRALLIADAQTGPLERGVAATAPELINRLAGESDAIGRLIGRWRVVRVLGRGGMGEVLLAERADGAFAQQAALKRLKRGMDSDELLRRFAQERSILAGLTHPNIARLLDGGVDADGRPYFAMEYVEGEPITEYARRVALGVRERVALMQRVCAAVAYAQGRLVVHRDLKPSNILVDAAGEPHLLDFGIAKLIDPGADETALTGTGLRVLSPAYAAPEQILGDAVSTATDVYSLGVLMFELLTGQLPHRRGAVSEGMAEQVSRETVERPSAVLRHESEETAQRAYGAGSSDRLRRAREVDGDLDRIVLTALRREPERRYASAAALGEDLRRFLDGRPIAARADTAGYRLRKFVRRHRVGVVATALVLLSLIAGLGAALWQGDVAREQAAQAQRERERAQAQARRAEQTTAFVVSLLRSSDPTIAQRGAGMTAVDLIRIAAERVDKELTDAPETQAELRVVIGTGLGALGAAEEGLNHIEAGIAQMRGFPSPHEAKLSDALHEAARLYVERGRLDDGQRASEEALSLLASANGDALALQRIAARTTLAKVTGMRGDLAGMETQYRAILEERRALVGPDDARLAVDWNNLGNAALRGDRYREAEHAFAEAQRVLANDPQAPESRQAWLRAGRGFSLTGLGDFAAAERELLAALEIAERTLHAAHPIVGNICNGLAQMNRYRGRLDEAYTWSQRATKISAASQDAQAALSELQLGAVLLAQGRDAEARTALEAADRHYVERRSREEAQYWFVQAALGLVQVRLGESAEPARIDAALAALEQRALSGSNAYAECLALRAEAARFLRDVPGERTWRQRQHEVLATLLGVTHARTRAARQRFEAIHASSSR